MISFGDFVNWVEPNGNYENYCIQCGRKTGKVHRIITDTGKAISFSKKGTCACGSRLVSWNPYKTTAKEGE